MGIQQKANADVCHRIQSPEGRGKFRLTSNVDISASRAAQISVSNAFPVVDLVQKCT